MPIMDLEEDGRLVNGEVVDDEELVNGVVVDDGDEAFYEVEVNEVDEQLDDDDE